MISKRTTAAVHAVLFIAGHGQQQPVRTHEVARALDFSISYMEGLLSELKSRGLLMSTRGPGGGYQLAIELSKLSIWDVVKLFEIPNPQELNDCREGQEIQSSYLRELHQAFVQYLSEQSLAQWAPQSTAPVAKDQPSASIFKFKPMPTRTVAHLPNSVFQWYKFTTNTQNAI
jgi:Rrf2 family transcriptional regulator, iron-sulfur cluster assembly transcription factor